MGWLLGVLYKNKCHLLDVCTKWTNNWEMVGERDMAHQAIWSFPPNQGLTIYVCTQAPNLYLLQPPKCWTVGTGNTQTITPSFTLLLFPKESYILRVKAVNTPKVPYTCSDSFTKAIDSSLITMLSWNMGRTNSHFTEKNTNSSTSKSPGKHCSGFLAFHSWDVRIFPLGSILRIQGNPGVVFIRSYKEPAFY